MNIREKKVTVSKEQVRLQLVLARKGVKDRRCRVYADTALEIIKEENPNLKVGKCLTPELILRNDTECEGEFVFELIKQKSAPKKSLTKTPQRAKLKQQKEKTIDNKTETD